MYCTYFITASFPRSEIEFYHIDTRNGKVLKYTEHVYTCIYKLVIYR